jgi:hypothetical protein
MPAKKSDLDQLREDYAKTSKPSRKATIQGAARTVAKESGAEVAKLKAQIAALKQRSAVGAQTSQSKLQKLKAMQEKGKARVEAAKMKADEAKQKLVEHKAKEREKRGAVRKDSAVKSAMAELQRTSAKMGIDQKPPKEERVERQEEARTPDDDPFFQAGGVAPSNPFIAAAVAMKQAEHASSKASQPPAPPAAPTGKLAKLKAFLGGAKAKVSEAVGKLRGGKPKQEKALQQGEKGGQYYVADSGEKVYVKE